MERNKRMRINLMLILIIGCCVQVSTAISDSCPVSPSTVDIVDGCPDSAEKWREAAARKNCGAVASLCDEPERLMYHCVINAFVNETLEVCAYRRNIVFGYCTEYSLGGNIIQHSFRANCVQFTNDPCPLGYQSTDAYKYPGCYELTKKTTAQPAVTSTLSTTDATDMNNEKEGDEWSSNDTLLLALTLSGVLVLSIAVLGVVTIIFMRRKGKSIFIRKKDQKIPEINEVESPLLIVKPTVDAETEDKHIAPSGQTIGNGNRTREIKILDEEILPEHSLKQVEDPKQDCQALLFGISDKLTELAKNHLGNSNLDIQLSLTKLRNEYNDPKIPFSLESIPSLGDDLAYLESIIEDIKNQKTKEH